MKRFALIFLLAIFLPSLVLGWLALRTAREQRVLIERQAAGLYQAETDALAASVRDAVLAREADFHRTIQSLLDSTSPAALAEDLASRLPPAWNDDGVPFAVSPDGELVFPTAARATTDPRLRAFLAGNAAFLGNRVTAEVYPAKQILTPPPPADDDTRHAAKPGAALSASAPRRQAEVARAEPSGVRDTLDRKPAAPRQVIPQKFRGPREADAGLLSKLEASLSDFQSAIKDGTDGVLARFAQNELVLLIWSRPPQADHYVFGAAVPAERFRPAVAAIVAGRAAEGVCLAVLDERARPVAVGLKGFTADWKRPFVSTEIGEALPHWEAALYLADPSQLDASARLVSLTVLLLIALALAAILGGGLMVALDTRRQLALAQKKTDFVSNVSHELKTPLTSIRMFAELLETGATVDPAKRHHYLKIITAEAERLTRLINNVLDFARIEKNRRAYARRPLDLHEVLSRLWNGQRAHLEAAGFDARWNAEPGPYPVKADEDAICQAVINLLSNAEKYSFPERKEITLESRIDGSGSIEVAVLDRGIGVPRGAEKRIFEPFRRACDSLAGGITGSGLGLTLARRIVEAHGGTLVFRRRAGGGSVFVIRLPPEPGGSPTRSQPTPPRA